MLPRSMPPADPLRESPLGAAPGSATQDLPQDVGDRDAALSTGRRPAECGVLTGAAADRCLAGDQRPARPVADDGAAAGVPTDEELEPDEPVVDPPDEPPPKTCLAR